MIEGLLAAVVVVVGGEVCRRLWLFAVKPLHRRGVAVHFFDLRQDRNGVFSTLYIAMTGTALFLFYTLAVLAVRFGSDDRIANMLGTAGVLAGLTTWAWRRRGANVANLSPGSRLVHEKDGQTLIVTAATRDWVRIVAVDDLPDT